MVRPLPDAPRGLGVTPKGNPTRAEKYLEGDVVDLHIVRAPLAEELDVGGLGDSGRRLPVGHSVRKTGIGVKRGKADPPLLPPALNWGVQVLKMRW